jgi:response regulator of citrate/malate metabolism
MLNIDVQHQCRSGWAINIENLIFNVLKKAETSLTINEVSQKINAHRTTTSKYLAVLEAKGMIKCRNVGKAKLYYVGNGSVQGKMKMVQV